MYRYFIKCAKCGSEPEIISTMNGNAYFAVCSSCGWHGNTIDISCFPSIALELWMNKNV